jgi:serine protease Do
VNITQLAVQLTQGAVGATGAATGAATVATVSATAPGYIGMRVVPVDSCGVRIVEVLPNTPAMTDQLIVKDVIVAVDGVAISGTKQLRDLLSSTQAGDTIKLTIQRAGAEMVVEVTLGARPAQVPATVAAATAAGGGSPAATAAPTMAATQ